MIGYSGHAFVALDCLLSTGAEVLGYCEKKEKENNPYQLKFLGWEQEQSTLDHFAEANYFIGIGDNFIRKEVTQFLTKKLEKNPVSIIHKSAEISGSAAIKEGVMIGPCAVVNAQSTIGYGTVCNSSSIVEHECEVEDFSHIGPGAVLCGNVRVGSNCLIGANSVIKPGIRIGNNVIVGAGTVVLNDVPDDHVVAGNPQRYL